MINAPDAYGHGAKKRSKSFLVQIKSCTANDYVISYKRIEGRKVRDCSLPRQCDLDSARFVYQQSFWALDDMVKVCEKLGNELVKM